MNAIALAGKLVSREINLAGIVDATGYTGRMNVQGEEVAKLDEWANELIVDLLGETGCVCVMGSEEVEGPISPPGSASMGRYAVLFDPVDGSSNIDIAAPVGTIFSVQRRVTESGTGHMDDLLQPGRNQAAAGYILYGSSTMFVYTTGNGVHAFTLDPTMGEFHLTTEDLKFPDKSNVYSTNEGNAGTWLEPDQRWVEWLKQNDPATGRPYSARLSVRWSPTSTESCSKAASLPIPGTPRSARASCAYCTSVRHLPSLQSRPGAGRRMA
jgi:fructose-1,6-bisphosphatase I